MLGCVGWAAAIGDKARHILDDHQAQFITSPVEQIRLNFDLQASQFSMYSSRKRMVLDNGVTTYMLPDGVETKAFEHL